MTWYLNKALSTFRAEVNARYPRRDKASDGTIGDEAHQSTSSDHNPDADGSVDAWDMDVEVNGAGQPYAPDVEALKRAFERHEASKYWIHNDQISFRSEGWKPRSYSYAGSSRNRHTQHVHFNTRTEYEGSTKPWLEDDMNADQDRLLRNVERILTTGWSGRDAFGINYGDGKALTLPNPLAAIRAELAAAEAREVARDAAQTKMLEGLLAAAGTGLTAEQLAALTAEVSRAAQEAGDRVLARLVAAGKALAGGQASA